MKKLKFSENVDCIIFLDGSFDEFEIFDELQGIPVLAADGAAIELVKNNIMFEKVIGDLDTLQGSGYIDKIPSTKIIYDSDQNTNDFEKVIKYAINQNYKNNLIFGFHGGQLEHSLNNWSVLMKYSHQLNFCIYEKGRYGIPLYESVEVKLTKNEIVSLIPQTKAQLSTRGFVWDLSNEQLALGVREGARNLTMQEEVIIDIHNGAILLFINSRLPKIVKIL